MDPAPSSLQYAIRNTQYPFLLSPSTWPPSALHTLTAAVADLTAALGGPEILAARLGPLTLRLRPISFGGTARRGLVTLSAAGFDAWTVVHELAHAWDAAHAWRLSRALQAAMGAGFPSARARLRHALRRFRALPPPPPRDWYNPGQLPPPCGVDANFNEKEDFAETVAAWVYPALAQQRAAARGWPYPPNTPFAQTPRGLWLANLLKGE